MAIMALRFLPFTLAGNKIHFGKTFSYLGPILDLLFVSAFMQASGCITHGMGVLLIIEVIAQALLNPGYKIPKNC